MVQQLVKTRAKTDVATYVGTGLLTAVGVSVAISLALAAYVAMNQGDLCYDPYECGQASLADYSNFIR